MAHSEDALGTEVDTHLTHQTIVILSTHIVADVSSLCSQMAVIQRGKILATATPQQATGGLAGSIWEATVTREKAQALKPRMKTISSHAFDGQMRLRVISQGERPSEEFTPATPTLEDYYFNLVSRSN
jgi:ABC-type multidrug transport system ATPase subunit